MDLVVHLYWKLRVFVQALRGMAMMLFHGTDGIKMILFLAYSGSICLIVYRVNSLFYLLDPEINSVP